MKTGGLFKGIIYGVAAYLVITYVWPKIKGSFGSLGFGGSALAFPGEADEDAMANSNAFANVTSTAAMFPGAGGGMGMGMGDWHQRSAAWQAARQQLITCTQGCVAAFRHTFPDGPHPNPVPPVPPVTSPPTLPHPYPHPYPMPMPPQPLPVQPPYPNPFPADYRYAYTRPQIYPGYPGGGGSAGY